MENGNGRERLHGKIRYSLYKLKILKKTSVCNIFYIKYCKHTIINIYMKHTINHTKVHNTG